jgi:hypothetical protein
VKFTSSQSYYLKRIVSKTIGHRNLVGLIKPSITPDVLPIVISTRRYIFSSSLPLSSGQIPLDDEESIRNSRKEDSDLRRRKRVSNDDERLESPDHHINVSKSTAADDSRNNIRHSRAQLDKPEQFADNNMRQENVDTDDDKLSSLPRNSHRTDKADKNSRSASQANLELTEGVALTKTHEDSDQSLNQANILRSQELLSDRLDQVVVSQRAGPSNTRDSSEPTVKIHIGRIEVRAVMPSSSSYSLYAKTEQQQKQKQKQPPSPSLSLNDYLKKRAGERK